MAVAQVRDVAARARVSPATVSNAINHPEKVSERTRERVRKAIEELDFIPNDAARQLRAGRNRAVGMIVLDAGNPFFSNLAEGAEDHLAEQGRPLLLGNSSQIPERESAHLALFEEQRVAGLLIIAVGDVTPQLRRLKERDTAVVIVDRMAGEDEFSSVSLDDVEGGRLISQHLIDEGARHIAVVGGPRHLRQVSQRLEGAESTASASPGVQVECIDTGAMDIESGRMAAAGILARDSEQRPDALMATNDLIAIGALQELVRSGLDVPGDMLLSGYDDIAFAGSATIPITSIRQPAHEMGRKSAELLCSLIDDPQTPTEQTVFQPELVIRESTNRSSAVTAD
ncbi:LacI family DNA-binding transcriptional regulator [Nesterenkonia aerolata]|uniref:LacI family DNA-binding transcriptional regulator n=1 Tax=Nesterenkonia aerolata TaxID=3074079 RepID=A0ABU2DR40_9MICC|nr:LacI family DNA-binding transcriptional regulator [Nesterenkonia sp. LY-0111]MDR8018938.1 LacI family DNA-binding transcriptional regulator [Nesterenkonia sp. LY-0111]